MWRRLLQNLGFTARVFPLYKKHPLNNYGENPGEIYSRVLDEITLEEQDIYEAALRAAGFDPTIVPNPVTSPTVSHTIGIGGGTTVMGLQVPVVADPPEWTTLVLELFSLSGGLDPEIYTFDPTTGDVSGSLGAVGQINLFTGTGNIDFGRILSTDFFMQATYTVLGTAYQAARVDVEVDTDETIPYQSGDRAAEAVIRAIEAVRPIHILLRFLDLGVLETEDTAISEGDCCGPNQAILIETSFPQNPASQPGGGSAGDTVFGGATTFSPIVIGSFVVDDPVSGQTITDDRFGGFSGDGTGVINYSTGLWWVQFSAPVGADPTVTYDFYDVTLEPTPEEIQYKADAVDLGEGNFDRSYEEIQVEYSDVDVDSDYKVLAPDFVAGTNYAGTLHADLVSGSVSLTDDATGQTVTDDGAGNLVGDVDGGGTNTVNYLTGAYDVDFNVAPTDPIGVFSFDSVAAHIADQEDIFVTKVDRAKLEGDFINLSTVESNFQETVNGVATGWTTHSSSLSNTDMIPGTVDFKEDPGALQTLSDTTPVSAMSGDGSGTINYLTGDLSVTFAKATGAAPTAKYTFIDASGFAIDAEVVLGVAGLTLYNVTLTGGQIVPGSVIVEDSGLGQEIQDDQIVSLSGSGSGTLNYADGSYSLTFAAPVTDPVIAEYDRRILAVF
jgi:hypothetical protein